MVGCTDDVTMVTKSEISDNPVITPIPRYLPGVIKQRSKASSIS